MAVTAPATAPKPRVSDVVRDHGDMYLALRSVTPMQEKVLKAIESCRTEALGGYVASCDVCTYQRVVFNPCSDRHCPGCRRRDTQRWVDETEARLLPCPYYHVVFTLPSELHSLAYQNARLVYGLLMRFAGTVVRDVLREPKHLGAEVGVTAVLHTWTQDLRFHPHAHCLVTAGGLTDDCRWERPPRDNYLAPRALLADRFKNHLLSALERHHDRGDLRFAGGCEALAEPGAFDTLLSALRDKTWHNVYAKRALGGAESVVRYLGRYAHRVAISDSRLDYVTDDSVGFRTKRGGLVELGAFQFLDRFLLHVLPHRFVRIRHYGLYAPPRAARLEQARLLLTDHSPDDTESAVVDEPPEDPGERCPECLFGYLERVDFDPFDVPPWATRTTPTGLDLPPPFT